MIQPRAWQNVKDFGSAGLSIISKVGVGSVKGTVWTSALLIEKTSVVSKKVIPTLLGGVALMTFIDFCAYISNKHSAIHTMNVCKEFLPLGVNWFLALAEIVNSKDVDSKECAFIMKEIPKYFKVALPATIGLSVAAVFAYVILSQIEDGAKQVKSKMC